MSCLCVIPARGGSKRIPKKNIKPFLGVPIIGYSITVSSRSGIFDEVMVSTDDQEIARISKSFGAEVPFIRSADKSDDYAGLADVVIEVINEYNKKGQHFDNVCCLLPTAPFVTTKLLQNALMKLKKGDGKCVFPVVEYDYSIFRSLKKLNDKYEMNWPENYSKRSQDLPESFHDAGQFYFISIEDLMKEKKFFCDSNSCILLDKFEMQDIDTEYDWKMAELKYKLREGNNNE